MSALARFRGWVDRYAGAKSLTHMVHGGGTLPFFGLLSADRVLPDTKLDYEKEVGDGLRSSVLMAPLNFIMRTFPEAPAIVERRTGEQWTIDSKHPLTKLLRRPNPFYGGTELAMATVLDLSFGDAYWLK